MGATAVHVKTVETSLLENCCTTEKDYYRTKENGEHSQELILYEHYRRYRRRYRVN